MAAAVGSDEVEINVGSSAAARKAGAYGGSEVGAIVGGMVGPPVIGGIIGNVVGEQVGEDVIKKYGLDDKAEKASKQMERVIGKKNTEKASEIVMTALGYSISEKCICFPCLPASQLLSFIVLALFCFNCFRLSTSLSYPGVPENMTLSTFKNLTKNSEELLRVKSYLTIGSAVWISVLPFYLFTLFGNCWRQCCCCLCDPIVCCATATDILKRCCCECGSFSFIQFLWYTICGFQIVWACYGCYYAVVFHYVFNDLLCETTQYIINEDSFHWIFVFTVVSCILDFLFAGSELIHKAYHTKLYHDQKSILEHRGEVNSSNRQESEAQIGSPA